MEGRRGAESDRAPQSTQRERASRANPQTQAYCWTRSSNRHKRRSAMLAIETVGLSPDFVPYLDGWDLQRRVHAQVVAGDRPDTLLLMEHEPVYTAGARTARHERPTDGTPVVDVDRGGKITWHGPGQLVGYPIVRLPEPMDVVAHVRRLEHVLIGVLRENDVEGYRVEGRSGVWVRRPLGEDKVAAIGVRVQKGVTMHGFALNCDNSLAGFRGIIPCGIADAGVTTVSEIVGVDISPRDILASVSLAFADEYAGVTA
ncbi:lipoyl(octanoyl) transferase LipB [Microbacterium allomyrinae]|uniref:Octanoyltransferase n=1 Tax=Microbacterium allomyrinae TaxID=2830666 RepID=A0A9X1LVC4_9MICO|nr:lipoyl(octanoyl) transferase LipB [Microbacterium allomyrinae]MCC2032376.1 lipoyl(octanoyl) transferase LipB [Microbacterium allomyrinae]